MKRYILWGALMMTGLAGRAQDIHFSQFYETSVLRNPALTGIFTGDYKVGALYRNQWTNVGGGFQTGLLSAEFRLPIRVSGEKNDFISFGLLGYYDKAGSVSMRTTSVYPAINYNKSLEDAHHSFLSVGFTGGYLQRTYDASKMTFDNQWVGRAYDPNASSRERNLLDPNVSAFDLGAGLSFSSSFVNDGADNDANYFIGVAAYHLTRPEQAFLSSSDASSRLATKINVNLGMSFPVSETVRVQLHNNTSFQGPNTEIVLGGTVGWQRFSLRDDDPLFALHGGVFYRYKDAIVPTIKLNYKTFTIGASYDVNLSTLKQATNTYGGFELSFFQTGYFKTPRWQQSRMNCPKF